MRLHVFPFIAGPARVALVSLCATLAMAALMVAALAQVAAPAPSSSVVNFTPLVDIFFWVINAVLVPVLGWIGLLLMKMLGTNRMIADEAANRMLHAGIQRGIDWVEGQARDWIYKDGKPVTFDIGSEPVAAIANRMIELSPELLKRIGVDEKTLQRLVVEALAARAGQTALLVEATTIEPARIAPAAA